MHFTRKNFLASLTATFFVMILFTGCGQAYKTISHEDALQIMQSKENFILLDVRTQEEYDKKHIPNAVLLPIDEIKKGNLDLLPDKDKIILIYCWTGRRAEDAAAILTQKGYKNIYNLGGIVAWTGPLEGDEIL